MLGSFPGYIALAHKIGARHFDVGPKAWVALGTSAWLANRHFLDEMVGAGDTFVLSVDPRLVRPGTNLFRELLHLHSIGNPIPSLPVWSQ